MLNEGYLLTLISVGLTIYYFKLINFEIYSIRGIVVGYFGIFYPFIIALVLFESSFLSNGSYTEDVVILNTLYAYLIFISMFLGVELFSKIGKRGYKIGTHNFDLYNSRILSLVFLFFLALVLRIILDLYFHVSINPNYNTSANMYQSVINRFHWLGLLPIFLFQLKYFETKRKTYLFISSILGIFAVLIYLPSGSRTTSFLFVPIYMFFILSKMKRYRISFLVCGFLLLTGLILYSGKIRVTDSDFNENKVYDDIQIVLHRLSDSIVTGKIIKIVPKEYEFRSSEELKVLLWTPFPHFIRTALGVEADFLDGVRYIWRIGLSPSWTSVPVTLLGDLYSRFGWAGIFFLSFILALILKLFEVLISKKSEPFKIIFISVYASYISQIYIVDLQVLFVTITREFLIAYALTYFLTIYLKRESK